MRPAHARGIRIMATAVALPPGLRNRIAAVAHRVRWLRFLRGLSLLVLLLTVGFGAALVADFFLDLSSPMRVGIFCAWAGLGLIVFLFGLLLPLGRRLDHDALAAVIEEKYPDLGERLTSAVELAGAGDDYHGSPELIDNLMRDTDARARVLNFLPAVSSRSARWLTAGAVAFIALTLSPSVVWPDQYADLAGRFFRPWITPPAFVIDATPAEIFAARGRPLTLNAHLTPLRHAVTAPDACTLVQIGADGKENRIAMPAVKEGGYSATFTPVADFSYRVEAGSDSSPSFPIETVQPVDLAADSPEITTKPPVYAENTVDAEIADGLVDVTVLQHGTVRFDCKFTRPAASAILEWTPTDVKPEKLVAEATPIEMALSPDRTAGFVTIPATVSGKYSLHLRAEHGVPTDFPARDLIVKLDEAPQFKSVVAKAELKAVLPYDRVPLEFTAADDVAVASAEVEYRVNQGEPIREPIAVTGLKTRETATKGKDLSMFALAGKVQPGDVLEYRLRISDNLPPEFAGPHVVYYPADHVLTLRVATDKEILALRDEINKRLDKIKEELKAEERGVAKTRTESRDRAALNPEQAKETQRLKKDNNDTETELQDLAKSVEEAPLFQPLADLARDVASKEMKESEKALEKAAADHKIAAERDAHFQNSEKNLDSALSRLDEMKKKNDELAQAALAEANLSKLADKERALADQAAELAAKDPVRDPSVKNEADKIKQKQDETANELKRLTEENPALRKALDDARAEAAHDLAERARELAKEERDLSKASADSEKARKVERLAELARKQQELADKAKDLAKETKQPTQAAKTNPLKPEDTQKAADALKQGDANEAVKNQDQAAKELDRVADELTKAVDLAKDPREAARQLARLEEALKQRVQDELRKKDPALAEHLKSLAGEQKAIHEAADRLSVPRANEEAQRDKKQAAEQSAKAAESMDKAHPEEAANHLEQAKQSLERLADRIPPLNQRKEQALREVAQLRQKQDEIAKQAEQAAQDAHNADPKDPRAQEEVAKKLSEAARKQADAAESLSKTDAPNQEAHQDRAQKALDKALKDLLDGHKEEAKASQQEAKHQLERLEQALKGEKPTDAKTQEVAGKPHENAEKPADAERKAANHLAQEQRQLVQQTQQAENKQNQRPAEAGKQAMKEAMEKVAQKQKELNEETSRLPVHQSQKLFEHARQAMNRAQQALDHNDPEQAKRQQNEAADALQQLAQKLPVKAPETAKAPSGEAEPPHGLPNKEQTAQARDLAKQQRELRDEVRRATEEARVEAAAPKDNPIGELAKQQQEVAKQAGEMAKEAAQERGKESPAAHEAGEAKESAQKAAGEMRAGALHAAKEAGKQASAQMRKLAKQLAQTPGDENAPAEAAKAEQLAEKQEEITRKLEPLADNAAAQRAQQDAQQQDLHKQTGELTQDLGKLARQFDEAHKGREMSQAQQAANSGKQAEGAMQQAQQQTRQRNQPAAQQSQQQAAQALEQAARQIAEAAGPAEATAKQDATGQSVQQAQGAMQEAKKAMQQAQTQSAQASMSKAAEALTLAAQQAAKHQGKPTPIARSEETGARADGRPDASLFTPEMKQYAGKTWGQLPGELRTKIVQQMKVKYGDDYARMIKLYFEQAADTRSRK
jgi:hypothetical protein